MGRIWFSQSLRYKIELTGFQQQQNTKYTKHEKMIHSNKWTNKTKNIPVKVQNVDLLDKYIIYF